MATVNQKNSGENRSIGKALPASLIVQFVRGYSKHKRYRGMPSLGIAWRPLKSPWADCLPGGKAVRCRFFTTKPQHRSLHTYGLLSIV